MKSVRTSAAAPDIRLPQVSAGGLGDVGGRVNLFRGDVNFTINLVSLQGRNNLDVGVAAFYGSNVHQQVWAWNMTAPTNVLGVGWALPFEQIVVSGQSTGSNIDDLFYLITGGAPKRLLRAGVDGSAILYEPLDYQFWKIRYLPNPASPTEEHWEILREDGSTYVYGLAGIKWGVKWNNWIGSTTVANGQPYPAAWNLVQVRSPQGDKISFEYDNDDLPIGSDEDAKYTRASRLAKIIDVFGQTVEFKYEQKQPFENQPPRVPPGPGAPNAFQYAQEEKYLDRISVRNENGDLLLTTRLGYDFYNVAPYPKDKDDSYKKRYLVSITQENGDGYSLPGIEFAYYNNSGDTHPGALKSIIYPQGGFSTYRYESAPLLNSATRQTIPAPGGGYVPKVWHGPAYVVVTWHHPEDNQLVTNVYSWRGTWNSWAETRSWQIEEGTLRVVTADGFYAIYYKDIQSQRYRLYLFRENVYRFGEWYRPPYQVMLDGGMEDPVVVVGRDFAAVADKDAGQCKVVSWDLELGQWVERSFSTFGASQVALAAGPNFFIGAFYHDSPGNLQLSMYTEDENSRWTNSDNYTEDVVIDWEVTTPRSLLSLGASFAVATFVTTVYAVPEQVSYGMRILPWSEGFQFTQVLRRDYRQGLAVANPVGFSVVKGSTIGNAQHLFRFDGDRWQTAEAPPPAAGYQYAYSYGVDAVIAATKTGAGVTSYQLLDYNPYDNSWHGPKPTGESVEAGEGMAVPTMSGDFRTTGYEIYYRTPALAWQKIYKLPSSADLETVQNLAPTYIAYQDSNRDSTHILLIKDGAVSQSQEIDGERVYVAGSEPGDLLAGPEAFVTYRGDVFAQAPTLFLYRVVDASLNPHLSDYSVAEVRTNNGYAESNTFFEYDRDTATYDPFGLVAQFVKVRVYQGTADGAEGYQENIFFNGLNPDVSGVVYPPSDDFTNARNFFSKLNGQIYQSNVYDSDGRRVQGSTNYLYTYDSQNSDYEFTGSLTRPRKLVNKTAGLLLQADQSYASGLDDGTIPPATLDLFTRIGFPLAAPVVATTEAQGRLWTITDGHGQAFQALLKGDQLEVYGWLVTTTEYEYNGKAQLSRTINSNFDSEGKQEKLVAETTFAWEVYPEFARLNWLTPVAQTKSSNETKGTVTGITVTTFKEDWPLEVAGKLWAPNKSFVWNGDPNAATFDFSKWSGATDPTAGWLKVGQILAITERALPISTSDAGSHTGGALYDAAHRFAVAVAANANPLSDEVNYYGFETYEDARGWTLTPPGENSDRYINKGDAFTGQRRLIIPGDPSQRIGLANSFTPADAAQQFLLSCWIKTAPGFVAGESLSGWQVRITGSEGTANPLFIALPATNGRWQYFHTIIDPRAANVGTPRTIALEVYSQQDGRYLLVDDIAFAPLHGHCRASVYNPLDKTLTATVNFLGSVRRIVYDYLQRPVAEIVNDDLPHSLWVDYLWRQHRDGAFDPTDPSGSFVINARGKGAYTNFWHGDEWEATWNASGQWLAGDGKLLHTGDTLGALALRDADDQSNYGLRLLLTPDETIDHPLLLTVGAAASVRWQNGEWELLDSAGRTVGAAPQPEMGSRDLLLIAGRRAVMFFADGRLTLKHIFEYEISGALTFSTSNRLTINELIVFSDPVVGVSYVDNSANPLQLQALDDGRVRVSASLYDAFGRAYVRTKSAVFDGELFGYRAGFTARLKDGDGSMRDCELTRAYPADEGYPFARARYESSPLSRPVENGAPGKDLAINPSLPEAERHTTRTTYGLNVKDGSFDDLPPGKYVALTATDPDGTYVTTISDQLGRSVASRSGGAAAEPGQQMLARAYYDAYGNLTKLAQPNALDPARPDARFVETMSYDFFGRTLNRKIPDQAADIESVYDTLGRLRFFQSPGGAAQGYINYLTYDWLGRLAEEGFCDCPWDRTTLQQHADDRTWLPAAGLWSRRYSYDGDGSNLNLLGRLWKGQVSNGDGTGVLAVETVFDYNAAGVITGKTTTVTDYDGVPRRSSFDYDLGGNVVRLTYDAENGGRAFAVQYERNGFNEITLVSARAGTGAPSRKLASYGYRSDGGVEVEIFNPGQAGELRRDYTYTPAGWLSSIRDRFYSEATQYTSGGYEGAGYYTGKAARATCNYTGVNDGSFPRSYDYEYAYDGLGRLQAARNTANDEWSLGTQRKLSYDANGNTIDFEAGGERKQFSYYDGRNWLRNTDGSATDSFIFNDNGDMTAAAPLGISDITYNSTSGLVTALSKAGGDVATVCSFTHDAAGSRVLKRWDAARRLYVTDLDGTPLALKTADAEDSETTDFLIYGPAGLIGLQRAGTMYNVLRGRLGSTRAVYDGTGLIAAYNYLPFGGFMGPPFEPAGAPLTVPYLFSGQELDRESGLYNFKARLYDPVTGRFISTDPAAQYASPYLYTGNDPINFYDPTGAFSWSWEAFGAVMGGVALIAGGVALTIATGGAATPLMIAGAVAGGALIGGGLGSAGYGLSHADASKSKFDVVEWGIMVGLGAAFGAASAGIGFATAGLGSVGSAMAAETAIGTGMGATDGVITNGAINAHHGEDFFENAGSAAAFGAAGGAVGGAVGGTLGRGPMLKTNLAVNSVGGRRGGRIYVATQNTTPTIWHSVVGTGLRGEGGRFTDLVITSRGALNTKTILMGGQSTKIRNFGGMGELTRWAPRSGNPSKLSISEMSLPLGNVRRARAFAENQIDEPQGEFNALTNGCTSWARDVVRAAEVEPPMWARTATLLEFWIRTLGRRKYAVA